MELIVYYLGFLAASFAGAFYLTEYLPPAVAYGAAGAAALVQWIFGWHYLVREKDSARVPALVAASVSALVILAGASAFLGKSWPLTCAAAALAILGLYKLTDRRESKLLEAGVRPGISLPRLLFHAAYAVPIVLLGVIGSVTGWNFY